MIERANKMSTYSQIMRKVCELDPTDYFSKSSPNNSTREILYSGKNTDQKSTHDSYKMRGRDYFVKRTVMPYEYTTQIKK